MTTVTAPVIFQLTKTLMQLPVHTIETQQRFTCPLYFAHGAKLLLFPFPFPNRELLVSSAFIAKYSSKGSALWAKPIRGRGDITCRYIAVDAAGNTYVMGGYNNEVPLGRDTLRNVDPSMNTVGFSNAFLAQFDAAGNPVWGLKVLSPLSASPGGIVIGPTGNVYFAGSMTYRGVIGNVPFGADHWAGIFYGKISQSGKVEWLDQIAPSGMLNAGSGMGTDGKGNIFLAGSGGEKFGDITDYAPEGALFFAKIRDTAFVTPNRVRGKVFNDVNKNCKQDPGEEPLAYRLLKAEPGPYYTLTDSSGNYQLELPAGTFRIDQIDGVQGLIVEQTCPVPPNAYAVTLNAYGKDFAGLDFGNQVTRLPLLRVDVAADRRRRCFRSTTTVRYCNEGYASAQNVQVKVYYPEYVVPVSASMAWNEQDSLLTFNIGMLQPGACGTISIIDSVICGNEAIRGLMQCVKAVITPKNTRPADPRWDGSDADLKAVCKDNGLVKLTIFNSGRGNMADGAPYRVYLDAVKVHEEQYKLAGGDSLTLQVPANGRTVRLEADLRPHHPEGERKPSITLEGCGNASASISKGFANQLPPDDAQDEASISCLPILDSFDPNDKQVSPAGVGPQHIITQDQELEYLIRFQNTGTDVAYHVTIEDSLDTNLDIATLQVGAASHPFSWSVGGAGLPVLTWKFRNINLTDSTSNEPASHGYVRFRIRQKAGTALGTRIANRAAIIFDYNSPVITNLVTTTIGLLPERTTGETVVDVCTGNYPTLAHAGENVVLDTVSTVALRGNAPNKGRGYWKLISGKGKFTAPSDPASQVTELGVGKNVLEWNIALCDTISRSRVTIERVVIPASPLLSQPAPYCSGKKMLPLTASGTNLKWYADKILSIQVGEGGMYLPAANRADTLYVTQTVEGYQSLPTAVSITIKPSIPTPQVDSIGYLCNGMLLQPIEARGENIRWYGDAYQTKLLQEGSPFKVTGLTSGTLYVTQTVNGCTSAVATVALKQGPVNLKQTVFVPNIITPNADGYNDAFRQPAFPEGACLGNFRTIRIYNRWGKIVFSSTDPYFAWSAQCLSNGLYYYEIRYSNYSLQGGLSVLY